MNGGYLGSRSDQMLETGFHSLDPRIGHFPHLLVKSGLPTIQVLGTALNAPIGLWGERPMFRADGSHYLEPTNGKVVEDFALWKIEANQEYLLQRANVGPDPVFKMFISANTPVEVLERTYEHFDKSAGDTGDVPYFGDYINFVCDWIPGLRWVLIPLDGHLGWSIFATALDESALVAKVRTEFKRKQIPLAHLADGVGRLAWIEEPSDN